MKKKSIKLLIILFLSLLIISCTSVSDVSKIDTNLLVIHYIDVGQGDSILIQFNGKNMLIDSGPTENSSSLLSYLKKLHITNIKYVITTHPHEDHIGCMDKIIDRYPISAFFAPKITTTTKAFENMISSLNKKSTKINIAKAGVTLDFDEAMQCQLLAPNSTSYKDLNDYSAVLRLVYENTSFIFMGDAQKLSEKEILSNYTDIQSDVIKIGHHGSRTSSSEEFIKAVNPKLAIISCGLNNDYGHPHKPTLDLLNSLNIKLFRTDKKGTIILTSDGKKIKSLAP